MWIEYITLLLKLYYIGSDVCDDLSRTLIWRLVVGLWDSNQLVPPLLFWEIGSFTALIDFFFFCWKPTQSLHVWGEGPFWLKPATFSTQHSLSWHIGRVMGGLVSWPSCLQGLFRDRSHDPLTSFFCRKQRLSVLPREGCWTQHEVLIHTPSLNWMPED